MPRADLLARLLDRGGSDLQAATSLARGEDLESWQLRRLRRRGFIGRAGTLDSSLIAPLLELERTVNEAPLSGLYRLLRSSQRRRQRELLLIAIAEQLGAERSRLREGRPPSSEELLPLLEDLRQSVERLDAEQADPKTTMRVAALAAEIVELIARSLTRRPRAPRAKPAGHSPAELAAAAVGLSFSAPQLIAIPDSGSLAAALSRPAPPAATPPRPQVSLRRERLREGEVTGAMQESDPLLALYGRTPAVEALARHATVAQLGRQGLERMELVSARGWVDGLGEIEGASELRQRPAAA